MTSFTFGNRLCHPIERLDQQLETLVCPPLSKRKNAVGRVSASCKVWRVRLPGEDAVRAHTDPAAPVFLIQSSAIGGHEYGKRVRAQEQMRSQPASRPVKPRRADGGILEVDGLE